MTINQKFILIKNILNLKNEEIADKLEITTNLVNSWGRSTKLKKIYLYAFAHAYNIPLSIFEVNRYNSEIEIKKALEKSSTIIYDENIQKIVEILRGDWAVYTYPSYKFLGENRKFWKHKLKINDKNDIIFEPDKKSLDRKDKSSKIGECILREEQCLIILKGNSGISLFVLDTNRIQDIFISIYITKTIQTFETLVSKVIFTKTELKNEEIENILGEFEENQLIISIDSIKETLKYLI